MSTDQVQPSDGSETSEKETVEPTLNAGKPRVVPPNLMLPFILVTVLFPLWGFANDITNPMVAAFKNILLISNFKSSLVQFAFYGGYACMAIPAAIFIKKYSYKRGVLLGLALYALGCLFFIPSGILMAFPAFLASYFIMTCGLSFLETTANPYVLSLGAEETSTRRLNLSQAFNPMGSICGMFVASTFILANLHESPESTRRYMQTAAQENKTVHLQVIEQQQARADLLTSVVEADGWAESRKLLKKGSALSEELFQGMSLLADPKVKEAAALQEGLARVEPVGRLASVMEVLQIKEPRKPTEAEIERDRLFFGPAGMEKARMLGQEEALLIKTDSSALQKTREQVAAGTKSAGELLGIFKALYEGSEGPKPDTAKAAALLTDAKKSLEGAAAAIGALPQDALKSYYESMGTELGDIAQKDLGVVTLPYALMGGFLLVIFLLFALKLPAEAGQEGTQALDVGGTLSRLFRNRSYLGGVIAQTFYVGAQIMCWTFIIQYAESELGISKTTAQNCNILAMIIFVSSRFICTFLLHYISPGALLGTLATGGIALMLGTIFIEGYAGLYCLIASSACMSLMFPTIYGIALKGLGDDAKLGSAGLILAIGGGCLMPPMQGWILDMPAFDLGFMELASARVSFFLPLVCFVVIALYGLQTVMGERKQTTADAQ